MTLVDAAILGQRVGRFGGHHRAGWIAVLFLVLVVALVVTAIVALIVWMSRTRQPAGAGTSAPPVPPGGIEPVGPAVDARRILDERLARGEIDPTEYRTRREALEG